MSQMYAKLLSSFYRAADALGEWAYNRSYKKRLRSQPTAVERIIQRSQARAHGKGIGSKRLSEEELSTYRAWRAKDQNCMCPMPCTDHE